LTRRVGGSVPNVTPARNQSFASDGDTDIRKAKGVRLQLPISSTNRLKIAEF